MKPFTSSILSDASYSNMELIRENATSFKSMRDTSESAIVRLLEFNEAAAKADMESTRDFYLNLLKSCNSSDLFDIDNAYLAIFNKYDAVMSAATNIRFVDHDNYDNEDSKYTTLVNRIGELSDSIKNNNRISFITAAQMTKPNQLSPDRYTIIRDFVKQALGAIKDGKFDEWSYGKDPVEEVCKLCSSICGIEDSSSIDEFITNFNSAIRYRPTEFNYVAISNNAYSAFYTLRDIKTFNDITTEPSNNGCDLINVMKLKASDLNINKVREVVGQLCDMISAYTIISFKISDIIRKHLSYIYQYNTKSMLAAVSDNFSVHEAMEIFGDEITSKSLFDDLDPEDFNRTEFMDLSLVAEHVYNMDRIEGRKYAIALEASLLAAGKYDELYKVNEAIGQSIKSGVSKLIEAVRKMISKFTETIMGNFATEKAYLTKYKNAILNSKVPGDYKITFETDILTAMKRLNEEFKIPTTSYTELIKKPERFESIDAFFDKGADFGITGFNRNHDVPLADDLKIFWGYKGEGAQKREVSFSEINGNTIADIYNFLLKTEKEAGRLRRESRNLDRTYKNYEMSAKQYAGDRKPGGSATPAASGQADQNVNSSYYFSAIYNTFMEANPVVTPSEPKPAANNNQQGNNNQNQQKDGAAGTPATNTKMTRGDTDNEVKKTTDDESKIIRNMEIYTKTCQAVISARATGYEYVHKQLMYIIRYIVKYQFGKNADISYATEKKPEQATEGKPAEQQTPAQNQGKK